MRRSVPRRSTHTSVVVASSRSIAGITRVRSRVVLPLLALLLVSVPAHAERVGSIAFGAAVGAGTIFSDALPEGLGEDRVDLSPYSFGLNFGARFRYKLQGSRGLMFSLESQEFAYDGLQTANTPKKLHLDVITAEYVFYFNRQAPRSRYLLAGLAAQTKVESRLAENESQFDRSHGLGLVLGAGTESFRGSRSLGFDLAGRVYPFTLFGGRYAMTATLTIGVNYYMQP
jgi:hypothetical protein